MRLVFASVLAFLNALYPAWAASQWRKPSEEEFVLEKPAVGDAFPSLTAYDLQGKEVNTSSLRGHYAVLTFGCLT